MAELQRAVERLKLSLPTIQVDHHDQTAVVSDVLADAWGKLCAWHMRGVVQATADLAVLTPKHAPACCQISAAARARPKSQLHSTIGTAVSPRIEDSADSSASSHFIAAPREPAECAGASGQQETRDECVSVWARCALRAGEQRTASDSSPRPLATRKPRRSRDLLARSP